MLMVQLFIIILSVRRIANSVSSTYFPSKEHESRAHLSFSVVVQSTEYSFAVGALLPSIGRRKYHTHALRHLADEARLSSESARSDALTDLRTLNR